jgi:stress-induced-phosphoprotein 1
MSSDQQTSPDDQEQELTPEYFKEKGNQCVKEKNYKEAIEHYSNGLRKNPADFYLYSNRSFAYLKLKQYYYALCDADRVISERPDFVKGYFRKAEVLRETFQYDEALLNYGRALKLEPNNDVIISNLRLTAGMCNRESMVSLYLSEMEALETDRIFHDISSLRRMCPGSAQVWVSFLDAP